MPKPMPPLTPSASPAAGLPLEDLAKEMPSEQLDQLDVVIDDDGEVIQNPDGSAEYVLGDEKDASGVAFSANLAEHLEESEMQTLAQDLLRKIEADEKAREKRDEQYEEGLRRTGMGNEAPGGADFRGASRVVHPMLVEACVDFCAASIKELMPPAGPAKTEIAGRADAHKYAVSQRQERYLNWQLREQISEFADEFEQLLTQLPMGGSQYLKFWYDKTLRRVCCEFIPIDDLYLPYACSDFYTAQRITHVQRLTQHVFEERIEDGFYRDIGEEENAAGPSLTPDTTKTERANDKIEGREPTMENIDGERIVYEVNTFAKLSIDGNEKLPYLVSIDDTSGKIVSIYRNWEPEDEASTRLDWIVEFGFIAWRGAYKIGMPHLIGGLSAAATGALRAILDSAHVNNLPGFLRLKGARLGGQTKEINPAQGVEIEGNGAIDDIRKLVMALPYNQPSPVLFELLGWLSEAARGVVTTAEEKIADASNQMPVGTALALMESGAKVFSSIFARLHRSMSRSFKILARLNKRHLSIAEQMHKLGEVLATRNDFGQPLAVIPVSDPNVFSEAQRFAQMQMVLQLADGVDPKTGQPTATAQLHNLYETLKRLYEIAKIPDFDRFLPPPAKPSEMNAAAENMAAMMGQPLMAFPEQKHLAHIEAHMRFITDPFLGGSGMAAGKTMPMMMEHVKQHLGYLYLDLLGSIIQQATGEDIEELANDRGGQARLDRLVALSSKIVHSRLQQQLAPLGPVIGQVLQQIAAMQPPAPMDPAQAVIMTEKMKQQGRQQELDKKLAADQQKTVAGLQQKGQEHVDKIGLEHEKLDANREKTYIEASQRRQELETNAELHGADLDHEDAADLRRIAHEAMQNDLQRHDAAQARQHDAAHEAIQSAAARAHEARQGASQQSFQAQQAERERFHQASLSAAERAHAAEQADAERSVKVRQHVDTLKDGQQARKQQAQLTREANQIKVQAAKKSAAKPKGRSKK